MDEIKQIDEINSLFSDFQWIDRGSSSQVYLAQDKQTNKLRVIKVIYDYPGFSHTQKRHLCREILFCSLFREHPHQNIVQFYQQMFVQNNNSCILVFEAAKQTLTQHLTVKVNIFDIFKSIIKAVEHLHNLSICHRDLKPDNILVFEDNTVKLCDFGLAQYMNINNSHKYSLTPCGSFLYSAPELVQNQEYSLKIDIWALGVIYYWMRTKTLPFSSQKRILSVGEIKARILSGKYKKNYLLNEFDKYVLDHCLHIDPEHRWSIKELLEAFQLETSNASVCINNIDVSVNISKAAGLFDYVDWPITELSSSSNLFWCCMRKLLANEAFLDCLCNILNPLADTQIDPQIVSQDWINESSVY